MKQSARRGRQNAFLASIYTRQPPPRTTTVALERGRCRGRAGTTATDWRSGSLANLYAPNPARLKTLG
jgi:hypothetical protein